MVYFDNAATSFPKPASVAEAVSACIREWCGNPGRASHALSLRAAAEVYDCREALAKHLGVALPERIVFTENTTHALNIAIKGLLSAGDHVLCSDLEHNAVYRPLKAMEQTAGITVEVFPANGLADADLLSGIRARIRDCTRAIVCTHASNICSRALPLAAIGALCRRMGLCLIVDAAQSAGHLPIHVEEMAIDALALPAHKGLFGIPGCGVLALGTRTLPRPLMEGGSGIHSLSPDMPEELPERLEAGTLPLPAIAALRAGLAYTEEMGLAAISAHEKLLFLGARERIESLPDYTVHERDAEGAVLLFSHSSISAAAIARALDRCGICARPGLHCAPLAHKSLGTLTRGAVRVSFSSFNKESELDLLWQALRDIR